jgi:hypothetical protein
MNLTQHLKTMTALLAVGAALNVIAADKATTSPYLGQLRQATPLELPNQSAQLVVQAQEKARPEVTVQVVKTAVGLNPAAAVNIVGSIAKQVPEMAPVAAGTAVALVPNQAVSIARVAAAAAPKQAGAVVEAVCRVLPKQYKEVALAVAEVVPAQGREILTGMVAAIPALKAPVNQVLAGSKEGATPVVATVLEQIPSTVDLAASSPVVAASGGSAVAPPTYGAPYVPLPGTPSNLDPGSGGDVPTGGRNYAAPTPQ